ncbi:MAG TPA: hydrogenase maturation protease [Ktedonobacteraceae bacterium]|nr:hydrogenase maturation protease [Ktedonobacteraceae bacterium]
MSRLPAMDYRDRRILIAGVGNVFLGDDGFGVEVARRLMSRSYSRGVRVCDFGIRGVELAYTLLDGYEALILVDATPRGNEPGTLYLIEPDLTACGPESGAEGAGAALDAHSMDPVKVLTFARTMGAGPCQILLVGCEPAPFGDGEDYTEMQMGLSTPVQAAVDEAVKMIDSLVEKLLKK